MKRTEYMPSFKGIGAGVFFVTAVSAVLSVALSIKTLTISMISETAL